MRLGRHTQDAVCMCVLTFAKRTKKERRSTRLGECVGEVTLVLSHFSSLLYTAHYPSIHHPSHCITQRACVLFKLSYCTVQCGAT